VGNAINVQINVTNVVGSYNGFETALYYDPAFLTANSIDFVTGTVWSQPFTIVADTARQSGAVFISMTNLGPTISHDGILANIQFTIQAVGVSPLTLAAGMNYPSTSAKAQSGAQVDWTRLVSVDFVTYDTATADGYFMNEAGQGRGPVAAFSYSPSLPLAGHPVSFNATQSYDLENPAAGDANIAHHYWDFGDGTNGPDSPLVDHTFAPNAGSAFVGNFSVRLTVVDADNNAQGMITHRVYIAPPPFHDVAISGMSANPTSAVAGAKVVISVNLLNKGTFNENYNLTVTYNTPAVSLGFDQGSISPSLTLQHTYTIDTTGLTAGSYQVNARVRIPFANVTSDESQSTIFTVTGSSNGSQLTYVALGAVGAIAALIVVAVILKRRGRHPDS